MIPTALWFVCGIAATVLVTVRVQLEILSSYPRADWMALVGGLAAGGLMLFLTLLVGFRMRSPKRVAVMLLAIPLAVLTMGCIGVTRFPESNFKDHTVRTEWSQLHPTLRLALWVVRLGESDLVLTDVSRTPDGYAEMGMAPKRESQHYLSVGGYAHAVDIRVVDTGEMRNWVRQGMFLMMGLEARRHTGTADHLHVTLPE